MSFSVVVKVTGLDGLPQKIKRFRKGILERIELMLLRSGQEIVGIAKEDYMRGPQPDKLRTGTGELKRSVVNSVKIRQNTVTVGSNLPYAAVHEFGFAEAVEVKGHLRIIKQAFGQPLKFPVAEFVRPFARMMIIPARPYLRPALRDSIPGVKRIIQRLANEALREAMA